MDEEIYPAFVLRGLCSADPDGAGDGEAGGSGGDAGAAGSGGDGPADAGEAKNKGAAAVEEGTLFEGTDTSETANIDPTTAETSETTTETASARPDWLPEKFWNADKGEPRLEQLAGAFTKLESAHGRLKQQKGVEEVPESAEDYFKDGFKAPEEADRVRAIETDDPVLSVFATVAHKYNIPPTTARAFAAEFLTGINEHLPEPVNVEAERESLGDNAAAILSSLKTWAQGLYQSNEVNDEVYGYMMAMGSTAAGVRTLAALREMAGEKPLPTLMAAQNASMTEAEWKAAYAKAVNEKNYPEQERLDALGEELFGTQPAGTSNLRYTG